MKAPMGFVLVLSLLSIGSLASAQSTVFFEEEFSGPNLDSAVWRTEVVTSGVRWCDPYYGGTYWGQGYWVPEGTPCSGTAAHSPYGHVVLSDGLVRLTSGDYAFPYLVLRLPGTVSLFPATGDWSFEARLRCEQESSWGTFLTVMQTASTEPVGNTPVTWADDVVMQLSATGGSWDIWAALDGSVGQVALVSSNVYEFHVFRIECRGNSYTISIDGGVVYGPITSTLRPTALFLGNPVLCSWGCFAWQEYSVDYIRVELPGPPTGACCFPSGGCLVGTEADCGASGGNYMGDGTSCDPSPCESTPVKRKTLGEVKSLFR